MTFWLLRRQTERGAGEDTDETPFEASLGRKYRGFYTRRFIHARIAGFRIFFLPARLPGTPYA
jgi:hypothetical protein